jgi:4'-phosphopantetheinyl transferase
LIAAHVTWLTDPGGDLSRLEAALTPEEQADFARLRLPARRRGFLLTRALLRHWLPALTGAAASDLVFERAGSGRLCLRAPAGWHISLSHATGLAAAMVATAPCGVDIELPRRADITAVARRYFAVAEQAWLATLPEAARPDAFFRLWTLKEAAAKAMGAGLAGHLDRLAFRLDAEGPHPDFDAPPLALWQSATGPAWLAAAVVTAGPVRWDSRATPLASLLA